MISPIYTVINDKIIVFSPQKSNKSYNGVWAPLYPCIQGGLEWGSNHTLSTPSEPYIRMGIFDTEENNIYETPFVWNHIRITSINIQPQDKTRIGEFVFNAKVEVCPNKFGDKPFEHYFIVKNGIYFFMNTILKSINHLLDIGKEITDIDFEFFDKQCVQFNFRAANHQPNPTFELDNCSLKGYYDLIENIEVVVYSDGIGGRNGEVWNDVTLKVMTDNKYFIKMIYDIIRDASIDFSDLGQPYTENSVTLFSFQCEKGKGSDYQYVRYERKLASNETHERIKQNLYKLLLINGLNRFNFEDAVSTFSIK